MVSPHTIAACESSLSAKYLLLLSMASGHGLLEGGEILRLGDWLKPLLLHFSLEFICQITCHVVLLVPLL